MAPPTSSPTAQVPERSGVAVAASSTSPEPIVPLTPAAELEQALPKAVSTIPLVAGRESEFWSQVFGKLPDMTKSQVAKATRVAISGPNALLLSFPKRYYLAKESLERGKDLRTIEEIAATVAGRPVRIQLEIDATLDAQLPAPQQPASEDADTRVVRADHPLVAAAVRVFGAKLVRVETFVLAGKAETDEPVAETT